MPAVAAPQAVWTTVWSAAELEANRQGLYQARLQRVRDTMRRTNMPALLVMDANNILYATGARNMTIFSLRAPSRYLLLFAQGPAILYEYGGCEHLSVALSTLDRIVSAINVGYLGAGGDMESACRRFAAEITATIRAVDPTVDCIGVDRFPFMAIDALRHAGLRLRDADEVFIPARSTKLPIEIPYLRESLRRVQEGVHRLEHAIAPGRSENEVWAQLWFDLMQKDGQFLTTRLCQSGPRTFPYYQEAGSRVLQAGDLLCLDTDAMGFEGYAADLSRSFLCGDGAPSAAQRQLYQLAQENLVVNAALLAPGRSWREFAERAWPYPDEYRPWRYGLIGHGLGLAGEFPNIP
ncbi:MAG: M24 family metallopeptidase, partial [Rhodoferax sp.]|nr:M24 family metallopeptidase [Rhodoferax sp.]